MFLIRASHINELYSTSGQYLHTALITLPSTHSTSKSDENDYFLYVANKTVFFSGKLHEALFINDDLIFLDEDFNKVRFFLW